MKLTLDFSELVSVLGFSNTILSDKSVDDKLKNVIFMVSEKGCKAVGYNACTFHRTELKSAEVEDISDDGWEFQVKASELNKIVSSFSSLYKTKVEKISFEKEGVKVRLTVYEEPIDEKDARLFLQILIKRSIWSSLRNLIFLHLKIYLSSLMHCSLL